MSGFQRALDVNIIGYPISTFLFSFLTDCAVPGTFEVPQRSEKEVRLRGSAAPPAGSILHRCTPPTALHHRDENEEHVNAGKEQRRSWVRDLIHEQHLTTCTKVVRMYCTVS